MKHINCLFAILLLMVSVQNTQAQNNAQLFAEGKDGKNIRLLWLLKNAQPATAGFWICKKQSKTWMPLNKQPLLPAIQEKLGETGLVALAQQKLQQKVSSLLAAHQLKVVNHNQFTERLQSDTNQLKALTLAMLSDFDYALMMGFGWVDITADTRDSVIEYGLFSADNTTFTTPLSTCVWNNNPDVLNGMKQPLQITANIRSDKNGIQLLWKDTAQQSLGAHVVGFRVYRKNTNGWDLINKQYLIPVSKNGKMQLLDAAANTKQMYQYAVVPVSVTGLEGNRQFFQYQPAHYPTQFIAPKMKQAAMEQQPNGWATISWDFPAEQEMFIKAFQVYEAVPPAAFVRAGNLVAVGKRSVQVKINAQPGNYVQYKVVAVYNNAAEMSSDEKLAYYLPYLGAPKPLGVQASFVKEAGNKFIQINWNHQSATDTLTKGYQLYVSNPYDGKMYLADRPELIKGNQVQYPIYSNTGNTYKICIASVNKFNQTGSFSDTVYIKTPSLSLPQPTIYPYSQDSGKVTLQWKYPQMPDLKGFRVYQNGNLVANEQQLNGTTTSFTTPQLKKGVNYSFTIQAVLKDGTESEKSFAKELYIFTSAKTK